MYRRPPTRALPLLNVSPLWCSNFSSTAPHLAMHPRRNHVKHVNCSCPCDASTHARTHRGIYIIHVYTKTTECCRRRRLIQNKYILSSYPRSRKVLMNTPLLHPECCWLSIVEPVCSHPRTHSVRQNDRVIVTFIASDVTHFDVAKLQRHLLLVPVQQVLLQQL